MAVFTPLHGAMLLVVGPFFQHQSCRSIIITGWRYAATHTAMNEPVQGLTSALPMTGLCRRTDGA